jgi:hypothetical protein
MEEFQTMFRDPWREGQAQPRPVFIVNPLNPGKPACNQEDGCGNTLDYVVCAQSLPGE